MMSPARERVVLRFILVLAAAVFAFLGTLVHQAFAWIAVGVMLLVVYRASKVRCPKCQARVGLDWPLHCRNCGNDLTLPGNPK